MSTPSSECSCSGSAAHSLRHFDDGADRFDRGGTSRLLSGQGDTNRTAVVLTSYAIVIRRCIFLRASLLSTRQRTPMRPGVMSARCQKETHAPQQTQCRVGTIYSIKPSACLPLRVRREHASHQPSRVVICNLNGSLKAAKESGLLIGASPLTIARR